ncbi:MAG: Transcriptional regulator, DeoR family [Verrucomicrobiales bacterium]|nr:Transcriptional regulator, DeoR family [Verrucomicrobiales bacterium]
MSKRNNGKQEKKKQPQPQPASLAKRRDTRNQDVHVVVIAEELNQNEWRTAKQLAKACACSTRTVRREMGYMIDDLLLPIERNNMRGFRATEKIDFMGNMLLTEKLIFTIIFALKSIGAYRTEQEKKAAERLFARLTSAFRVKNDLNLARIGNCISFGSILTPKIDPNIIDLAWLAAFRGEELGADYATPNKKTRYRTFKALHIRKLKYEIVALCKDDSLRGGIIRLALNRMHNLKMTGTKYKVDDTFDGEKEFDGALDSYTGEKLIDMHLYFRKERAHLIHENHVRGGVSTQVMPSGAIRVHLRLSSYVDVLNLLGEFGDSVVAQSPPELVQLRKARLLKELADCEAVEKGTFEAV